MVETGTNKWTVAQKKRARTLVNVEVRFGRIPRPNSLPCADCGHVWVPGGRRHEYDHYHGYDDAHALDVEAVCTRCQRRRSLERGEIKLENLRRAAAIRSLRRKTRCKFGHPMSRASDGKWRCRECRLVYWRKRGKVRGQAQQDRVV